jgi:Domain of unknown function (DUF6378)
METEDGWDNRKERQMNYKEMMDVALATAQLRGGQYGDMVTTMDRISKIATLITGKIVTAYDVAMVLHAVKLGRLQEDRSNPDHYVDGMNYLTFAGQFATSSNPLDSLEDDFAAVAKRYAPRRTENANETANGAHPVSGADGV